LRSQITAISSRVAYRLSAEDRIYIQDKIQVYNKLPRVDWYMSVKRKVNYTNGYAVIDPVSLTMLTILLTSILINLTIRSFQCEFVLSECSAISSRVAYRLSAEDRIYIQDKIQVYNKLPRVPSQGFRFRLVMILLFWEHSDNNALHGNYIFAGSCQWLVEAERFHSDYLLFHIIGLFNTVTHVEQEQLIFSECDDCVTTVWQMSHVSLCIEILIDTLVKSNYDYIMIRINILTKHWISFMECYFQQHLLENKIRML
jgi:hypothetical protein